VKKKIFFFGPKLPEMDFKPKIGQKKFSAKNRPWRPSWISDWVKNRQDSTFMVDF